MQWGIKLKGHEFDLFDWRDMLSPPFDPHVEVIKRGEEEMFVLFSDAFETCSDAMEVRTVSIPMLRRLNALMSLQGNGDPLQEDGVIQRTAERTVLQHHVLIVDSLRLRSRLGKASLTVHNASGEIIQQTPQPSFAQTALRIASEEMNEALEHFSRADNWHDLYKAFEAVENVCGGRASIRAQCGVTESDVTTCARNINFHRHHRPESLGKVWTFDEARSFVGSLIAELLKPSHKP
jgi:hypothetical protein